MASSFLINSSKKITVDRAGTDGTINEGGGLSGIPWTWYGNITDSSLSSLTFSFQESFKDSREAVDENFEKITKALKKAIEIIVGKIPLFGKVQNFDSLRTAVIFAYSAFATMADSFSKATTTTDTDSSSNTSNVSKKITELFSKDYMYRPPVRKGMPRLTVPIGNSIKIEFNYGACNMFDAYKEVFQPIHKIYEALSPKLTQDDEDNGMGSWNVVDIPYNQQILPEMLSAVFSSQGEAASGAKDFLGFMQDTGRNLSQIASKLRSADDRWASKKDQLLSEASDKEYLVDDDKNGTAKYNDKILKRFQKDPPKHTIKTDTESVEVVSPTLPSTGSFDAKHFIVPNNSKKFQAEGSGLIASGMAAMLNTFATYKESNPSFENGLFYGDLELTPYSTERELVDTAIKNIDNTATNTYRVADLDKYVVAGSLERGFSFMKEEAPKAGNKSLEEILVNIVNFEYNLKGKTLKNLADKILNQTSTLSLGFPDIQDTSLDSLYRKTYDKSKIHIHNILFEEVEFSFDFSHLDERGYPMAGSITFKKIWNVKSTAETLSFSDANSTALISEPISISS